MVDRNELIARLEKVEKQNRRMKLVGSAVTVVLVVFIVIAPSLLMPDVLEVERVDIMDSRGARRACFGMVDKYPRLALFDEHKRDRITVSTVHTGSGYILHDENGVPRGGLCINDGGGPCLSLTGEHGKSKAQFGVLETGPYWELIDKNESRRAGLFCDATSTILGICNKSGEARAALFMKDDVSGVVLRDDEGEVVFEAPEK